MQIAGLMASIFVFVVAKYWPRALDQRGMSFARVLGVGAVGATLVFPLLVMTLKSQAGHVMATLPASWAQRFKIWSFTVERCLEKPWFGWGYESARQFDPMIPNHPHSMALQAWLELGIPGLFLLAAFWGLLFWHFKPQPRGDDHEVHEISALDAPKTQADIYPYLLAAASLYFVINSLSYGLWRSWLYALGAICAMLCIMVYKAVRFDVSRHSTTNI
jgi:O-antigen ligase